MLRWIQGWQRRLFGSGREVGWPFPRLQSSGNGASGSTEPVRQGPGIALLLSGGVLALLHLILFPPLPRIDWEMATESGTIAETDIRAPMAFSAPLLEQDVELRQIQQVLDEPPVLRLLEPSRQQSSLQRLSVFAEALRQAQADPELSLDERSRLLAVQFPHLVDEREIERALTAADTEALLSAMQAALTEVMAGGVADMLPHGKYNRVLVVDERSARLRDLADLTPQGRLLEVLTEALRRSGLAPGEAVWVASLLRRFVTPNMVYDAEETRKRQDAARQRVPVSHDFIQGEKIVGGGERITDQQSLFLQVLRDHLRAKHGETAGPTARLMATAMRLLVLLAVLSVFGWLGHVYFPTLLRTWRSLLALLFFLSLSLVGSAIVLHHTQLGPFAVPVVLVALLATVLFKERVGFATGLLLVVLLAILPDVGSLDLAALVLLGLTTVVAVRRIQKRSQTYQILVFLSLFSLVLLILVRVVDNQPFTLWRRELLVALLTPTVSVIFALFILPLLEPLVGVSSDLTLLELSDLNHPLLKRMALAVPGTYHHSQVVAQLAEQAARAIGANALLVRVGALFHDIGKMVKPDYYVENQRPGHGSNKHDELTPSMSALIIASHVREGIELARRWRLPREVIDFIPEHHGTQVMEYFYHKALEGEGNETVKVDDFRYPGPKPRRRETAVLMLADAVEAATRSLAKPTPSRIKEITKQLCDKRMLSGELDESQLTLSDVARIREAFIPLLTGIHHARIAYPGQKEMEEARKAREEKSREARTEET
jgi:putative nucleotidyltransferase with HDIG domain